MAIFSYLPDDVKTHITGFSIEMLLLQKIDEMNKQFSNYFKYVIGGSNTVFISETNYDIIVNNEDWKVICDLYRIIPHLYKSTGIKNRWVCCEQKRSLELLYNGHVNQWKHGLYNLKMPNSPQSYTNISRLAVNILFLVHFPFAEIDQPKPTLIQFIPLKI